MAGARTGSTRTLSGQKINNQVFTYRVGLNYVLLSGFAPTSTSTRPPISPVHPARPLAERPSKPTTRRRSRVEAGLKFEPQVRAARRREGLRHGGGLRSAPAQRAGGRPQPPGFFNVQTGQVEVKGVELEAVMVRIRELASAWNASYTYMDTNAGGGTQPDSDAEEPGRCWSPTTPSRIGPAFAGFGAGAASATSATTTATSPTSGRTRPTPWSMRCCTTTISTGASSSRRANPVRPYLHTPSAGPRATASTACAATSPRPCRGSSSQSGAAV